MAHVGHAETGYDIPCLKAGLHLIEANLQSARRCFLGLSMLDTTLPEASDLIRRAAESSAWSYVVTPNAAHIARIARDDVDVGQMYQDAQFCLLDSRVLARVARVVGLRPPSVIVGADLVRHLFRETITDRNGVCVIGASESAVAQLRGLFRIGHLHHFSPPMGFWRDELEVARAVDFIIKAAADYTFLVVGSPQQEMLAHHVFNTGRARGVGICAGASIDFLTGVQKRAPHLIQRLGLEWAFRWLHEPRRLSRRYLVESPQAVWLILRHGLRTCR